VFFLAVGAILYGYLFLADAGDGVSLLDVVCVYALAWLAGTVTPGAPGGLGVREAVLTASLGPIVGHGPAAAAALGLRGTTTAGDLLTALIGWTIRIPDDRRPSP
jgi:uncharacterized membrane protein YbhN (UPF0104 family)